MQEAKLIKIGNSRGIRLPKHMILKYGLGNQVVLEETDEGILIHTGKPEKLSWEETYKAMAVAEEGEWVDWESLDEEAHL